MRTRFHAQYLARFCSRHLYKHVRGLHNAGQRQDMHTLAAPARFRARAQASAVAPVVSTSSSSSTRFPADPGRIGNLEGGQHIAAARLGRGHGALAGRGAAADQGKRIEAELAVARQPPRQFGRLVVAPLPEPRSGAAAPARSDRCCGDQALAGCAPASARSPAPAPAGRHVSAPGSRRGCCRHRPGWRGRGRRPAAGPGRRRRDFRLPAPPETAGRSRRSRGHPER